jgi:transposase
MMFWEARPMTVTFSLYVGVDIAATSFAATWASDPAIAPRASSFDQTADGYHAFQLQLTATGVAPAATLVALEATGTYWVTLATHLHQTGYAVAVLNPAQVAQYARSLPRRAKTDALDAQLLLRFAAERKPARWEPPEQVYHELRQRLVVRDSMLHMRTQARNQRHAVQQWPVRVSSAAEALDSIITELEEQIDSLDREIAQVLADGAWAASATILLATPGLGPITTAWLLVGTLNFSLAATPEQLTAYIGLAPMPHESGSSVRGRRRIGHTGNGRLRTALYMATLNAARYNPTIKAFYQRLRTAGKPMKVARYAAARKLLHLAWALVKKQQHYCAPQAAQPDQLIV